MRCTSFFSPRRARAAALALCTLALPTHLVGQQPVSIPAARTDGALPRIRINGVHTVRSLAEWPGISLKVEQASHVVVFAVTRGREDVPLRSCPSPAGTGHAHSRGPDGPGAASRTT